MYSSLQRDRVGQFSAAAQAEKEEEEKRQKKWDEEAERQRQEKEEEKLRREQERKAQEEERRRNEAAEALNLERRMLSHSADSDTLRRHTLRAEMRRIAGTAPKTELEKREARIKAMNDNAELMKDLLVKNAKKRAASKKKKQPIEDRIRSFFTKMEVLKADEEEADLNAQNPTIEQKRRYVLMTKGVKAALEIKDDDDEEADNPIHTL